MYANRDPRTEQLAIDALDEFYAAGGTLPIVFESSGNPNSWAVTGTSYFDWNTPKLQAAVSVEQAPQPASYGLTPGQWRKLRLGLVAGSRRGLDLHLAGASRQLRSEYDIPYR